MYHVVGVDSPLILLEGGQHLAEVLAYQWKDLAHSVEIWLDLKGYKGLHLGIAG